MERGAILRKEAVNVLSFMLRQEGCGIPTVCRADIRPACNLVRYHTSGLRQHANINYQAECDAIKLRSDHNAGLWIRSLEMQRVQ
ncbi:unnamed protein product [Taenia asiatica]|uniref:RNase H domain-containing protein n=1 Tax=Taenia asiatica TaxID=60517 RepID=A0A0R3W2M4_TAEAS|nr:unnamed protein product [Taenia asiatica]